MSRNVNWLRSKRLQLSKPERLKKELNMRQSGARKKRKKLAEEQAAKLAAVTAVRQKAEIEAKAAVLRAQDAARRRAEEQALIKAKEEDRLRARDAAERKRLEEDEIRIAEEQRRQQAMKDAEQACRAHGDISDGTTEELTALRDECLQLHIKLAALVSAFQSGTSNETITTCSARKSEYVQLCWIRSRLNALQGIEAERKAAKENTESALKAAEENAEGEKKADVLVFGPRLSTPSDLCSAQLCEAAAAEKQAEAVQSELSHTDEITQRLQWLAPEEASKLASPVEAAQRAPSPQRKRRHMRCPSVHSGMEWGLP